MNERTGQRILLKVLELVILRHQVDIVDVFEKGNCFGFWINDNFIEEILGIIVNDLNIEEVLPINYRICSKIFEDKDGFVGFCKE